VKFTVSKEVVKLTQTLEHSPQVRKLLWAALVIAFMVLAPLFAGSCHHRRALVVGKGAA